MPFTVLLSDLTGPTAEQLVAAYKSVGNLAASDAIHVARYQFGILAENLPEARAYALASALMQQGVKAAAVDQTNLPPLPPPKTTRQLDCLPEALTYYDALGRGQNLAWDNVVLVALGGVGFVEERKRTDLDLVPTENGARLRPVERREQVETTGLVLEILLDAEPWRIRTSGDTLLFPYLGQRRQPSRTANIATVISDLVQLAPRALINRGAAMLTQQGGRVLAYQNRAVFEKEMIWLLWWSSSPKS